MFMSLHCGRNHVERIHTGKSRERIFTLKGPKHHCVVLIVIIITAITNNDNNDLKCNTVLDIIVFYCLFLFVPILYVLFTKLLK